MKRDKKILLASIVVAVAGWITAAVFAINASDFRQAAGDAKKDATTWKRQAGKAYTELLKERTGADGKTVIPAGSRIENGKIYPPRDY
ncbi:hypothetical protein M1V18_004403 [Salmonella enterica]|nr:hypothetical protein [Salmonella enterica]